MSRNTVYLIDENEQQRRTYVRSLTDLFSDCDLRIEGRGPLPSLGSYASLLANNEIAAFILDQKLEDGGVDYSGTQLSSHLRGIVPKIPIVILTNYAEDLSLFAEGEGDVEYIISKRVMGDPSSREAQIFKSRFLRRLNVFSDILGSRESRYHELLVRSLNSPLSEQEQREMDTLEGERMAPVAAVERSRQREIDADIQRLKDLLKGSRP